MSKKWPGLCSDPACTILAGFGVLLVATTVTAQVRNEYDKLAALDAAGNDRFGYSVAIDGDTMVMGAYLDDCIAGADCGSAYVFGFNGNAWVQQAKLTASDAAVSDVFGVSVSISGDTIVVGAPADDCAAGLSCGAAYIFVKPVGGWSDMTQTAKLIASDASALDVFGQTVSISGDRVVVASYLDDCVAGSDCGSVYVFTRPGGGWVNMTQNHKLTASDAAADDQFGYSVSIDGDTIVVGARWDDCTATTNCGSAYVYRFNGVNWIQQGKLTASVDAQDNFGVAVSISGDTIVVGAGNSNCGAGSNCGSAYIFVRPGAAWANMNETAKLSPSNATAGSFFGNSVAIAADTVVVGAAGEDCGAGLDCGSAYVYLRPSGGWANMAETAALRASDPEASDFLGSSVSIKNGTIVSGSFRDDCVAGSDCGAAYVFHAKNILYVNASATGSNDGSSWANAFRNLQDALTAAQSGDQIWVAQGIYRPDRGVGMTLGDRTATFQLLNGVTLYGGFNGTETLLSQRNPTLNTTILSGDLGGDDTPVSCTQNSPDCDSFGKLCVNGYCIIGTGNSENTFHIVTGSGRDATAVLDGFSIVGGNANGSSADGFGAGMNNVNGDPAVVSCKFIGNFAIISGGGIFNNDSSPTVRDCKFTGNGTTLDGAGMYTGPGNPTVSNSTFAFNSARSGGGMFGILSSPTVTNCTFQGNSAVQAGGGIVNGTNSTALIANCRFLEPISKLP